MDLISSMGKQFTEAQLFNGKHYYWFLLTKDTSVTGRHSHDYYEFTIVMAGRYYQQVNNRKVLLNAGDYLFIPLGSEHESLYEFGPTTVLNIGISRTFFHSLFPDYARLAAYAGRVFSLDQHYFQYIQKRLNQSLASEMQMAEFLEQIIFYCTNHMNYAVQDEETNLPAWLQATLAQLHDKAYFREDALENMVKLSGKTQEYLTRTTRKYLDKTPMQIITEIRINHAKTLLSMTNFTIGDIAEECGFNDASVFIKNFKKLVNYTPNHYRKLYQVYQKEIHT